MAYDTLILSREESFAVITLNRPPANAISEPLIREIGRASCRERVYHPV